MKKLLLALLLYPGLAWGQMPVQVGNNSVASGNTVTVTLTGIVPSHSLVMFSVYNKNGVTIGSTITDSAGNSYNSACNASAQPTNGMPAFLTFFAYNATQLSVGNTVQFKQGSGGTGAGIIANVAYVQGIQSASDPCDGKFTTSYLTTLNPPQITSATPAAAGDLVLATGVILYGQTISNPAGWSDSTAIGGTDIQQGYMLNPSTATQTWTPIESPGGGGFFYWGMTIVSFKTAPIYNPILIPTVGP